MEHRQHSFDHFGLHSFAIAGDDEGVDRALNSGADVNSLDSAGRSALMCAVAGEQWQKIDASNAFIMTPQRLNTIRRLLRDPRISLLTLNAPQSSMNGVVPLGMAAWLNKPEAVRLLLEESSDIVSVDGMDAQGATALMYAARDGGLQVVQLLLSHGARPDFRDCNHRTSIQFALDHPQILWLFESTLRRHRWRESQSADRSKLIPGSEALLNLAYSAMPSDSLEPPPLSIFKKGTSRLTHTLISSVCLPDVPFLRSLLFSPAIPASSPPALYPMSAPILVNRPDASGWSPIHYCAAAKVPCIDVLDALYCAGADISLFTTHESFTVLHILAKSACPSAERPNDAASLYYFTMHLVRDLRAPLSARDRNEETCIHIAAEHGQCIELLMILLELDSTGTVRDLRNARGLTALEICKPEFRFAFGENTERLRSVTSLSTLRAVASFASLVSLHEPQPYVPDTDSSLCSMDFDIEESMHQLLFNLRACSPVIHHANDSATVARLRTLLAEATHLNEGIIRHFRSRVDEATKELEVLRSSSSEVQSLLRKVTIAAIAKLGDKGFDSFQRRRARDSEDSQATMFYAASRGASSASIAQYKQGDGDCVSVATQTIVPESPAIHHSTVLARSAATWFGGLIASDASTYNDRVAELLQVDRALAEHRHKMAEAGSDWNDFATPGLDSTLKQLEKRHRKLEDKVREIEDAGRKSLRDISPKKGKFLTWVKRIITQDKPSDVKLQIIHDIDEVNCAVGRETRRLHCSSPLEGPQIEEDLAFDTKIEMALKTSKAVLNASSRDIRTVNQSILAAEQFIQNAVQSISRAERVAKRALKKREAMLTQLRTSKKTQPSRQQNGGTPGALGYNLLTLQPSIASLSSISSEYSVCSTTPTLMENDDDDTRTLRRLLKRKIEATILASWDEMDSLVEWLRIVKEATRSVKRRAYL
ncbi:hypothetical protein H0H93_009922 [Arthromyces matolae]|nr:hypothetical protein H0H93_009922 [Arthromyces matolae]